MKILLRVILLAALLFAGWWLWNFLFPSAEKIVRKKMTLLATTASFGEKTNPITRAAKANKVVEMFAPDAQIVVNIRGHGSVNITGRDEISERALAAFGGFSALHVEFLDLNVRVGADRQFAEVNCTAKVSLGDNKDYSVQEMQFSFIKSDDGNWRIVKVETVETLS